MHPDPSESSAIEQKIRTAHWSGLGLWNLYFVIKLFLYSTGHINLHIFYNIFFALFLIAPVAPPWLYKVRNLLAFPAGAALFYYDSWFPPLSRVLEQTEVSKFSNDYLLEFAFRFVNWGMIGATCLVLAFYFLVLRRIQRLTLLTITGLFLVSLTHWSNYWVPYLQLAFTHIHIAESSTKQQAELTYGIEGTEPADAVLELGAVMSLDQVLDSELASFYATEQDRLVTFDEMPQAEDFDLLFLNICSLSWDDLQMTHQTEHPLFAQMDIMFEQFNAATSYSSPAVQRLLQANCGQQPHQILYESANEQCYLFSSLQTLGFETQAALNHNGQFQNLLDDLLKQPAFEQAFIPESLEKVLKGFDDSPIWSDYQTLDAWWTQRQQVSGHQPTALLYNSISLHDGNRTLEEGSFGLSAPYEHRVKTLLDDILLFLQQLRASGRRVLVIFIPEHGAAFRGDTMQVVGLREIPTQEITLVPVGLSFIGVEAPPEAPLIIEQPSSFLALAELLKRIIKERAFTQQIEWVELIYDLPETALVSENEAAVALWYEGQPYVRINGRSWADIKTTQ